MLKLIKQMENLATLVWRVLRDFIWHLWLRFYLWPFCRFHNGEFTMACVLENKSSLFTHPNKVNEILSLFCAFKIAR